MDKSRKNLWRVKYGKSNGDFESKGGVGKTTTSINLASGLAHVGKKYY